MKPVKKYNVKKVTISDKPKLGEVGTIKPKKPTWRDKRKIRFEEKTRRLNDKANLIKDRNDAKRKLNDMRQESMQVRRESQELRKKKFSGKAGEHRQKRDNLVNKVVTGGKITQEDLSNLPGNTNEYHKSNVKAAFTTGKRRQSHKINKMLNSKNPTLRALGAKQLEMETKMFGENYKADFKHKQNRRRTGLKIAEKVSSQMAKNAGLVGAATALAAPAMVEASKDEGEE